MRPVSNKKITDAQKYYMRVINNTHGDDMP